jgi:hypothetical protein
MQPLLSKRACLYVVAALTVAGIVCRLGQYLSNQSFWEDEIALLRNLQQHSPSQIAFTPLNAVGEDAPVAAPPAFLWITQWLGNRFDYAEWSVRLLPLLCSIGAMGLLADFAWRILTPFAAVWAVWLFALSDPLLFQAGTAKPYSGDALLAILIAWTALAAGPGASVVRRLAAAGMVTAVGIWLSYTSFFTFAAAAVAFWPALGKDRWERARSLAACAAPALVSFLAAYIFCVRAQRQPTLDQYWMHLFPDPMHPLKSLAWVIGATWEVFHFQMYPIGPIMLIGALAGVWTLGRANRPLLILLVLPIGLDLLASFLQQYPYGGTRATLFLCPFICLLCGVGAAAWCEYLPGHWRWSGAVLALVPLAMTAMAGYQLVAPRSKGEMRDAVRFLLSHRRPGEPVYLVGQQTAGAANWYLPHPDPPAYRILSQTTPIYGGQFWVVISYEPRKYDENKPAMSQPGVHVDESRSLHIRGADVLWFKSD